LYIPKEKKTKRNRRKEKRGKDQCTDLDTFKLGHTGIHKPVPDLHER
jgi:hypothetical protein